MSARCLLLLSLCSMLIGSAEAEDQPLRTQTALPDFRKEAKRLTADWEKGLRKTVKLRARLEAVRRNARRDERTKTPTPETRTWRKRWEAAKPTRALGGIGRWFPAWSKALAPLTAQHDKKPLPLPIQREVNTLISQRVAAWIDVGEPHLLLRLLRGDYAGIRRALQLRGETAARRAVLQRVLIRTAETPGMSDVDALTAAVDWCSLILATHPPAERLDLLSRDMIVLLTERGEDGISKSNEPYYTAGRFRDRGFHARFQDGSDQVRHFAWAFRMFAASKNAKATAWVLTMKEQRDAATRKLPLNKADLALNEAARKLLDALRGGTAIPTEPNQWAGMVARALEN